MVEEVVAEAVDLGILLLLLLYLQFRAVPGRQISSHGIPFPRPDREQIGARFNDYLIFTFNSHSKTRVFPAIII